MKFFLYLFKDFGFARKRIGSTWYLVDTDSAVGFAGSIKFWTQKKPENHDDIIETENW